MGFNSVFRILQELFPKVDSRILRAAAIQHSNDPDRCVEFILTEALQYTTEQCGTSCTTTQSLASLSSDTRDQLSGSTEKVVDGAGTMNKIVNVDTQCLNKTGSSSDQTIFELKNISDHLSGNTMTEQLKVSNLYVEEDARVVQDVSFQDISVPHTSEEIYDGDYICNLPSDNNGLKDTASYIESDLPNTSFSSLVSSTVREIDPISNGLKESVIVDDQNGHSNFHRGLLCGSNNVDLTSVSVEDHREDIIEVPDSANIVESSSVHSVLTRSGQHCSTALLEEIIENSKSHKKTLFSVMESVTKLMKEVELEEKIAQETKEKAVEGGFEVHAKVEELKKMLSHAREANDMRSGEVYGERAILSTEMRELQSRLLALSDEKDNSLSLLNVMQQDLETRLAAAEAERITAEQEICEKEESARRALVEQELIMEKVVQESKTLQHEAEENTKLREFLVDRGHVVDVLQGEISVICEDVKLLKEKYDAKVPLRECLSSKQTSCIIASSGSSSLKSSTGLEVIEQASPASSKRSSNHSFHVPLFEKTAESYQNESLQDGWELF